MKFYAHTGNRNHVPLKKKNKRRGGTKTTGQSSRFIERAEKIDWKTRMDGRERERGRRERKGIVRDLWDFRGWIRRAFLEN